MTQTVDLTPPVVGLAAYGGDTFVFTVHVNPPEYVAGGVWSAQVRWSPGSPEVLEFFTVTVLVDGACLELSAAQTQVLADLGAVKRGQGCYVYQEFRGAWDTQVMLPDGCVQTLARGSITVTMDVSRD